MGLLDILRSVWRGKTKRPRKLPRGGGGALTTAARYYFSFDQHWKRVSSSNVHSIAYFSDLSNSNNTNILGVKFQPEGQRLRTYYYFSVPLSVFTDMVVAASKGRFVWRSLRDKYDYFED